MVELRIYREGRWQRHTTDEDSLTAGRWHARYLLLTTTATRIRLLYRGRIVEGWCQEQSGRVRLE